MEPSWLFCQQKCFNTTTYKNFSFIALEKDCIKIVMIAFFSKR